MMLETTASGISYAQSLKNPSTSRAHILIPDGSIKQTTESLFRLHVQRSAGFYSRDDTSRIFEFYNM